MAVKSKQSSPLVLMLANLFGAFGYIAILIQLIWLVIAVGLPYLQVSGLDSYLMPMQPTTPQPELASSSLPPYLEFIIAAVAVVFSIGLLLYALIYIPRSIGRFGQRATSRAASTTVKQVTALKRKRHHPLPKKQQRKLYEYLTWSVKLVLIAILLLLSFWPLQADAPLSPNVVHAIALFCASVSLVWFGLQWLIGRLGRLDVNDMW